MAIPESTAQDATGESRAVVFRRQARCFPRPRLSPDSLPLSRAERQSENPFPGGAEAAGRRRKVRALQEHI